MLPAWSRADIADIAGFAYGLAALAFALLALLLLSNWRARRHARPLTAVCVLTALWAAGAAGLGMQAWPFDLLEALRTAGWLLLLLLLPGCRGLRLRVFLGLITLMSLAQGLAAGLAAAGRESPGSLLIAPRLLLAVVGLLLVEQLYRHTHARARWGIKFACLGAGVLFAYDFYLYSDALLFRRVQPDIWAARGIVDALAAPLLAISAARNPAWDTGLAVSRQLMLSSATLVGAAIYLLAMATSAYYLRYVGGAWGPVMQLASLFGAAVLLVGLLFSGSARASLKVLINKHFYQGSFDYRHEWLRLTRALADGGPALGERAIQAVAELVESPAGALWLCREGGRCEAAASWNLPPLPAQPTQLVGDALLCEFMETRQWVIDVAECQAEPQRYGALALPPWLQAVAQLWLLVPLMLHGRLFGFIALLRPRSALELNWEVKDLLKIAGSQAAACLAQREAADSLMVARQFESVNRMSTFIAHDLKNLASQLSLLLANAERHKANPAFQDDMLATLAHSVSRMTELLGKLSRQEAPEQAAPLALAQLLERAVRARAALLPQPRLEIDAAGLVVLADWQRLERVLGHLIQNAVEASARDGSVTVRLSQSGAAAVIELRDTGQGMSEQFIRERLFKPFDSTKPAGMGIGVFESREYIREVGGQLEVHSEPAVGTTFRVILPLHAAASAAAA